VGSTSACSTLTLRILLAQDARAVNDPIVLGDTLSHLGARRALRLDGLLRAGRTTGHLARSDVAQGDPTVVSEAWWDEPDFLLIDMPPGTGDVALTLSEVLPRIEMYVVTTPQAAAQRVAQRSAYAARKLKLSVRGVIENMSWFTGDDEKRYEIFGAGGGARLAQELGIALLGQIPSTPNCAKAATWASRSSFTIRERCVAGVQGAGGHDRESRSGARLPTRTEAS